MNVLVTGGAGFIGSHVVTALHSAGHSVIVIDDLNDYYDSSFKQANLDLTTPEQFYKVDLRDSAAVENIFATQTIDLIIHLGARAGVRPSLQQPDLYTAVNVMGTLNLLNAAVKYHVPRIIFGSTSAVYGNSTTLPFQETADISSPISPYAASKAAAENLLQQYHTEHHLQVTILRFFTVYGERGRPDMAPYLFTDAILHQRHIKQYGDGLTSRDYTYIADIVQGIMAAVAIPFEFEIINLGNNQAVSLNDFIKTLEAVTGETALINKDTMQAGDVNHTLADITKAQRLLHYQPTTDLAAGLKKFVDWYKVNRL